MKIPVETSARHVHLSEKDFKKLFGKGKKLIPIKKLSQPGEFASDKTISIVNKKNKIENVRVVGPLRKNSQIEISLTDAYKLKLSPLPKIRVSGDLNNASKVIIKNKNNPIKIPVIIAKRHLHCSRTEAKKLKLKNNEKISIKVKGARGLIFNEIIVRAGKGKLALHLDTDEANAAGILGKTWGEIVR